MEDIVANSDNIKFDVEVALEQQVGVVQLAFPGMDSKYLNQQAFIEVAKLQ